MAEYNQIELYLTKEEENYIAERIGDKLTQLAKVLNLNDIKEDNGKNERRKSEALEAIEKWKTRDGETATRQAITEALRSVKRNDIADELEIAPVDVEVVTETLRNRYKEADTPKLPWDDPEGIPPITELYVEPDLIECSLSKKDKTERIIQLEELFSRSPNNGPQKNKKVNKKRYLITGAAGYGKTVLLKKVAFDWAWKKDYMKHYELVIFVQLKNIENSLRELVEKEAGMSFHQLQKLENKVLLLIDGYDELPPRDNTDLHDLLGRRLCANLIVVLSSKVQFRLPGENSMFCDSLTRIHGFNDDQAKKYLKKYLRTNDVRNLWDDLESNLNFSNSEFLTCPLFMTLLSRMQEKKALIEVKTKTDLFIKAFNFIVRCCLVRKGLLQSDEPLNLFNDATSTYKQLLHSFGKLAWENLKTGSLHVDSTTLLDRLEPENCEDQEKELVFEMGIFVKQNTISYVNTENETQQRDRYEPFHQTFIVFAAAVYLAKESEKENFKENIQEELMEVESRAVLNILNCFIWADEMTGQSVYFVTILKEAFGEKYENFFFQVLLQLPPVTDDEREQLCTEFENFMAESVSTYGVSRFLPLFKKRLDLKQIRELRCFYGLSFRSESIEVEMLMIRSDQTHDQVSPLPSLSCKRLIFQFDGVPYQDQQVLKQMFKDAKDVLHQLSTKKDPLPEITLLALECTVGHLRELANFNVVDYLVLEGITLSPTLLPHLEDALDNTESVEVTFRNFSYIGQDILEKFFEYIIDRETWQCLIGAKNFDEYLTIVQTCQNVFQKPLQLSSNVYIALENQYCEDNDIFTEDRVRALGECNIPIALNFTRIPRDTDMLTDSWNGHQHVQEVHLDARQLLKLDLSIWPQLCSLCIQYDFDRDPDSVTDIFDKIKNIRLKNVLIIKYVPSEYGLIGHALRYQDYKPIANDVAKGKKRANIENLILTPSITKFKQRAEFFSSLLLNKVVRRVYIVSWVLFIMDNTYLTMHFIKDRFPPSKFHIRRIYTWPEFILSNPPRYWSRLNYVIEAK